MKYTLVLDNPYQRLTPELLEAFALNVPDPRFPHVDSTHCEYRYQALETGEETKENVEQNNLSQQLIKIQILGSYVPKTKHLQMFFSTDEYANQFIEWPLKRVRIRCLQPYLQFQSKQYQNLGCLLRYNV